MKQDEEFTVNTVKPLKFVDTKIVFAEIPDEISMAFNISGCPIHCPDCHSKYLWEDTGTKLDLNEVIEQTWNYESALTCLLFMGGDASPEYLISLVTEIRKYMSQKDLYYKIAWYSGNNQAKSYLESKNCLNLFDYVKEGEYDKEKGGLNKETTNQHLYKINRENSTFEDITYRMWNKNIPV